MFGKVKTIVLPGYSGSDKIQFTIEEYSKRHHGGYLGERSRELSK